MLTVTAVDADRERVIVAARDELDALPTPLTPGELQVLDFFDEHLSAEWEIYYAPHLNGLRPDFVLLNPRVGIAVYEVKDWHLSEQDTTLDNGRLFARILGASDGRRRNTRSKRRCFTVKRSVHSIARRCLTTASLR